MLSLYPLNNHNLDFRRVSHIIVRMYVRVFNYIAGVLDFTHSVKFQQIINHLYVTLH
jgi:hypothetical protein